MTNINQRVEWIDVARGLFMIFIVCFHYDNTPAFFVRIVYTFTMSFFFFVSGMFFSNKQQDSITFIIKNLKKFIPLIVINAFLTLIKKVLVIGFSFKDVKYMLKSIVFQVYGCESLWFLACNFCCLIIMYFIIKITTKPECVVLICTSLSISGCLFTFFTDIALPWSFDIALIQMLFMGIGYYYKNNQNIIDKIVNKLLVFLFIIYSICVYFNPYCDIHRREYTNIFIYYVQAFVGVALVVVIFKNLINKPVKVISYLGKNSLYVYAFHGYCIIVYNMVERILPLTEQQKEKIIIKSFLTIGVAIFTALIMCIGIKIYFLLKDRLNKRIKTMNTN